MCDVAARCPACGTDLAAYETKCSTIVSVLPIPGAGAFNASEVIVRPHHRFECECGTAITITEPLPGFVMTRQDAVVKP